MHWTLREVWDLPMHYYEFLVDELNAETAKAKRR
jgi:hypothetical protein